MVKMLLVAAAIRAILVAFPATGPALNPALATGWQLYKAGGELPSFASFWQVYWLAACAGAFAASAAYAAYSPQVRLRGLAFRH